MKNKILKKFFAVYHIREPKKAVPGLYFRELDIMDTFDTEPEALRYIERRQSDRYFQFTILPVYEFVPDTEK